MAEQLKNMSSILKNGNIVTIDFFSSEVGIEIKFCHDAIKDMQQFQQKPGMREAGGLLFSTLLHPNTIEISKITTPTWLDIRFASRFIINKRRAQKTINKYFNSKLHYVGDWHTHTEVFPRPSGIDISTIVDLYQKSDHQLLYFLLVILSSSPDFTKSYVALVNRNNIYKCVYKKDQGR